EMFWRVVLGRWRSRSRTAGKTAATLATELLARCVARAALRAQGREAGAALTTKLHLGGVVVTALRTTHYPGSVSVTARSSASGRPCARRPLRPRARARAGSRVIWLRPAARRTSRGPAGRNARTARPARRRAHPLRCRNRRRARARRCARRRRAP